MLANTITIRNRARRAGIAAISAVVVLLARGPAANATEPPTSKLPGNVEPALGVDQGVPTVDPTVTAPIDTGETTNTEWRHMSSKAEDVELLPVIVGLDITAKAEGVLSSAQAKAQRRRIDADADAVLADLHGKEFTDLKDYESVPFLAMHVSPEALAALRESDQVASVSEDRLMPVAEDPIAAPQATSSNQNLADWWDLSRVGARTAWTNGYDGRGQTVAILDTGVQQSHPALAGKIVAEGCYSTLSTGSSAGGCPNGSWTQTGSGAARYCTYSSSCSHGTHVAGTAAGIYGVARRANVMPIQVFHRDASTGRALSYTSDQLWGLKHVYDRRNQYSIAAANLSIGGGGYTRYCDDRTSSSSFYAWAQLLRSVGIATVVSAGNDGYYNALSSPACNSNVVSVGNSTLDTNGNDAVYSGSNRASFLSLYAPGTHICSSVPTNRYECWNGTSMAAPHVTGAFAALKQLRSSTTVAASLTALQASGRSVYDSVSGISKPRMNVWSALTYLNNH